MNELWPRRHRGYDPLAKAKARRAALERIELAKREGLGYYELGNGAIVWRPGWRKQLGSLRPNSLLTHKKLSFFGWRDV